MSRLRERADLRVGAEGYHVRRVGWPNAGFLLERQGVAIARADPEGLFRRSYRIRTDRATLTLKPRGFMRPDFVLVDGESELGWIRRAGFWRTTMEASFSPGVERWAQVFVVWIVVVLWHRAATAAAAG